MGFVVLVGRFTKPSSSSAAIRSPCRWRPTLTRTPTGPTSPPSVHVACACLRRAGLPRALPALLHSAAHCEGAGAYVGGRARAGCQGWVTSLEDGFVGTALVGAYAACGCMGDARIVFDRMAVRDVVSWGVMLDSYCQTWNYKEALLLFAKMKDSGVLPDQLILATVLSACGHIRHLRTGRAIHLFMLVSDILISTHLSSALINLCASCSMPSLRIMG